MNSIDFCFWLQGFFELSGVEDMNHAQVEVLKKHLDLVFVHEIDPLKESETTTSPDKLNVVHHGGNDVVMRC